MENGEWIITVEKKNGEVAFFLDKFMEKKQFTLVGMPVVYERREPYAQDKDNDGPTLCLPIEEAKKMAREILALEGK